MQTDEEGLIRRAQKGNREAFEHLVRGTSRLVYSHLLVLTRHPQQAEDLTQETYLHAWKAIAKLTEPAGFRSWLLTIARNLSVNEVRAARRLKRGSGLVKAAGSDIDVADPAPDPAEASEVTEQQEQLLQLLEALPEDYRQPLMLRYLAGADHDAIRGQLGLTDGALRGLLHRGMTMLRERMTQRAEPADER